MARTGRAATVWRRNGAQAASSSRLGLFGGAQWIAAATAQLRSWSRHPRPSSSVDWTSLLYEGRGKANPRFGLR